jgi:tetratricopeptide (TPR) repeat protein
MQKIYPYIACALSIALAMHQSTDAHAQTDATAIFSAPAFWEKLPSADAAQTAWQRGAKLQQRQNSVIVYHNGSLYGFSSGKIPDDPDKAVQGKLNENYAVRAEMRNIHALGIMAFNDFQCGALAEYSALQPDMRQCSDVKFSAKFTGVATGHAFSIASLPAENVCACRKALDLPGQNDNSAIFYAPIAVNELARLHAERKTEEFIAFFENNYRRGIFSAPELLMAAEVYADKGSASEAVTLLDAVTKHFGHTLTSEQYESCGDLYFKLGREQAAIHSYEQAGRLLNQ